METTLSDNPLVLVRTDGQCGRLTLNRPSALHALNLEMVTLLTQALVAWRDDPTITTILLDHSGPRGFCAGGDIAMLAASGAKDGVEARAFFYGEYRLNHLIFEYPKPVVAIMDGITMGGGVGLAIHAPFRIATERTVFAMPETGIGLFPDVGGGWFLPRLEGQIGVWLALTGARLKGGDAMRAGVATHFVPSELLGALKAQVSGAASTHDPRAALRSGLAALDEDPGPVKELSKSVIAQINACFCFDKVEAIIAALEQQATPWALAQIVALSAKSPQTLKVALRQIRLGSKAKSFADDMVMEYAIATRIVALYDFQEGVRAVIIDKDNAPKWQPQTLVGMTDALLDSIFAPLAPHDAWTPL